MGAAVEGVERALAPGAAQGMGTGPGIATASRS